MTDLTPEIAYVYELCWPGTDEIYIGSTSRTPEERFKQHQRQPYACYSHLGIENAELGFCFDYKPAHNCDRSAEARWKRLSKAFGYIVLDDGDLHCTPLRASEEARKKMSEALKGSKNHFYGKKHSEATKQKQSEAKKGAKHHLYAPFTVTWPCGRILRFETTHEAAAHPDIRVSHQSVTRYLNGKRTPGGNKRTAHLKGCVFAYV